MIAKVAELARDTPEVTECHRVTGEDCFVMRLHVRDVLHLEELIDRFVLYGQTTTSIVQSSPVPGRGPRRRVACSPCPIQRCPRRSAGRASTSPPTCPAAACCSRRRRGGVSAGPFASLNLGRLTADDGANVDENRERLAAAVGLPRERFLYGRQVHGATVRRATEPPGPARPAVEEDGQATALDDAAALVFVADCLPVMLVADGAVAALTAAGAGSRPGSWPRASPRCASSARPAPSPPRSAPSARGCCYEVGEEVHAAFAGVPGRAGGRAQPRPAPRSRATARRRPASETVHDTGLCTICAGDELFFSHRRDGGVTGRQAGVVWRA